MSTTVVMQDPTTPTDVSDTHLKSPNQVAASLVANEGIIATTTPTSPLPSPSHSPVRPSSGPLGGRQRSVSVTTTSRLRTFPAGQRFGGELRRSETFSGRMTRKRPAENIDLLEERAVEQELEDPVANHIDSAPSLANHICLCQPAPKIPRPRNAFILYRQNRHSDILAKHPNLPNPEISKIAGRLWAKEPDNVKNEWKRLAAEEKARHAEQYPDYRFQPRHRPKRGGISGSPTFSIDQLRCPRCGGRSITSAGSPASGLISTPSVSAFRATPSSAHTPISASKNLPQLSSLRLNSPQEPLSTSTTQYQSLETPESMAENKKRRFNTSYPNEPHTVPGRLEGFSSVPPVGRHPYDPYSPQFASSNLGSRRVSFPPPIIPQPSFSRVLDKPRGSLLPISEPRIPRNSHLSMGPPPTPSVGTPTSAHTPSGQVASNNHGVTRRDSADGAESLKLPPLHKHSEPSASIETFIRGMNFLGKLHILRKTAPPLNIGRSSIDSKDIRMGSMLAVEGDKGAMLDTVMAALEDALRRTGEFDIKVIHGPNLPHSQDAAALTYKNFVDAVSEWHSHIPEIVSFLRGPNHENQHARSFYDHHEHFSRYKSDNCYSFSPRRSTNAAAGEESRVDQDNCNSAVASNATEMRHGMECCNSSVSHVSESSFSKQSNDASHFHEGSEHHYPITPTSAVSPTIPLLIVPQYLLHASDAWAAALPVTGEYGVPDHWQWTATLWRGVPGPDFVLYVKVDTADRVGGGSATNEPNDGSWVAHRGGDSAWNNSATSVTSTGKATVELKEDIGVLIVRQERDGLGQSAVRRIAFEVGEWARAAAVRFR